MELDDSIKVLYPNEDAPNTITNAESDKIESNLSLSSKKVSKLNKVAAKDSMRLMKDWNKWRPKPKKAFMVGV